MKSGQKRTLCLRVATIASLALVAPTARAQTLETFLAASDEHAVNHRESEAFAVQARSAVDAARARLLPSFTAIGSYQRNEVEIVISIPTPGGGASQATIAPFDQLSASLILDVPLVDLSAWWSFFATESFAESSVAHGEAVQMEVRLATTALYYQRIAAISLLTASQRAHVTAEETLRIVRARLDGGVVSEVDVRRAEADVARAQEAVAAAQLQIDLSGRSLFVLTGIEPGMEGFEMPVGPPSLEEAPLQDWLARLEELPGVRAASAQVRSAEQARDAASLGFLPVVGAAATQRFTNAPGFGPEAQWAVSLNLSFRLDFGRPAALDQREAGVNLARAQAEGTRATAETQIIEAYRRIQSLLVRLAAVRTTNEAASEGARLARLRFAEGAGTALEVSQAERDQFMAEVAAVQTEAELALQRSVLRLRSGVEP